MVFLLATTACASQAQGDSQTAELLALDKRLSGRWRLKSYRPQKTLGSHLLLALGADSIAVRFASGRIRSDTELMKFDREMRISDPFGARFRAFIKDEQGLEYEVLCVFNSPDEIEFEARTDPWRGHGVFVRE